MLIVERQARLLELLRQKKTAQFDELARQLDVSVSTVRRDLEVLETKGQIERTHGGVLYVEQEAVGAGRMGEALASRMNDQVPAKQSIGQHAAALVQPNMTLLLDGGSTVIYAARQITARPIQVVTCSLAIAHHFAEDEQVELTLIGGHLYPRTGVMVGTLARQSLKGLFADMCMFSLASIDQQAGYNINLEMARTQQLMIRQVDQSIMLMDSGKFGHKSLVRVCGIEEVSRIITDGAIAPAWRRQMGDRLVVAGS